MSSDVAFDVDPLPAVSDNSDNTTDTTPALDDAQPPQHGAPRPADPDQDLDGVPSASLAHESELDRQFDESVEFLNPTPATVTSNGTELGTPTWSTTQVSWAATVKLTAARMKTNWCLSRSLICTAVTIFKTNGEQWRH